MAWAAAAQGGLSAFGNAFQGESAKKNDDFNAAVANQNANLSIQQSVEDARRSRVIAAQTIGQARANYGASGMGLTGSALDVLGDSAAQAKLDELTILANGKNKAAMYGADAQQDIAAGNAAQIGGYLGAAGNLLSSGSRAYGSGGGYTSSTLSASRVRA